jgi:hypothetical protein
MTTAEVIGWWLVAAVGLGGSMLCSGIETGLYATSPVRAFVRARVVHRPRLGQGGRLGP